MFLADPPPPPPPPARPKWRHARRGNVSYLQIYVTADGDDSALDDSASELEQEEGEEDAAGEAGEAGNGEEGVGEVRSRAATEVNP